MRSSTRVSGPRTDVTVAAVGGGRSVTPPSSGDPPTDDMSGVWSTGAALPDDVTMASAEPSCRDRPSTVDTADVR